MAVNTVTLSIAMSVLEGLSLLLTLFRLWFRLRIQRFWWEDAWAAVSFVCGASFIVGVWIYIKADNEAALVAAWVCTAMFTSIVWAVRMSLIFSIIRIVVPTRRLRRLTYAISILFVLTWSSLMVVKALECGIRRNAKAKPACSLPKSVASFELATDVAADTILIFVSLRLLWRVKLPTRQRRMILCIFSSCAVMTLFSLLHALCQLIPVKDGQAIFLDLEIISSTIVCNLLVVVTYAYRVILAPTNPGNEAFEDSETSTTDDDFTTPTTQRLTTLDFTNEMDPSSYSSHSFRSS
ncbi:hypothetical protein F5I97DRAFT_29967 [Phlebopus sp. FC_14]|nr:hypothetical protein F5I97DRAFT_29967 [Phlebopus sp. FC_14]